MAAINSVLGLDIGHHSAKVVRAVGRRGRIEITHAESLRIPTDIADRAEVVAPWLKGLGFKKTPCVVSIAGHSVMFQPVTLAPEDPRTHQQAVDIEIAKYNEMASESMVYDFAPLSRQKGEKRLLLVMARPQSLEEGIRVVHSSGMELIDIVPSPVAMYNGLVSGVGGSTSPMCFINVGHVNTDVAIGTKSGVMFARSFATGGSAFTDAVAGVTGHVVRHAEDMKIAGASLDSEDDSLSRALTQAADMWFSELEGCLSLYRNLYPDPAAAPFRFVLCGGGSDLRGFTNYVKSRLGKDVAESRLLSVEKAIPSPSHFAVARGLAMSGLGVDECRISLLPPTMKEEVLLRRQKVYWVGVAACAAVVLGLCLAGGYRDIRRQQTHLTAQQAVLARCQRLADEIHVIEAENTQIKEMAAPLDALVRNGPFLRDLIALLARQRGKHDWITMICDPMSYVRTDMLQPSIRENTDRTSSSSPELRNEFSSVIVEGYTPVPDLVSVVKLIAALNESSFVRSADLLRDDRLVPDPEREDKWKGLPARKFIIEVVQRPSRRTAAGSAEGGHP